MKRPIIRLVASFLNFLDVHVSKHYVNSISELNPFTNGLLNGKGDRMKKNTIVVILLLSSFVLFAQQGSGRMQKPQGSGVVTGVVIDSIANHGVEYATVALLATEGEKVVTGNISNESGAFTIENIPTGSYKVRVTLMGYGTKTIEDIKITNQQLRVNLGNILISSTSVMMEGAEITAQRDQIQFQVDKTVVNVDKMNTPAGGSAIDILRNTPSVTVDMDNNVSLRGNEGVQILIDGRPSGISATRLLEQLPASAIERIEIVTNPSARYDAEGTAGVINIILKKSDAVNFNGMIMANIGTRDNYSSSVSTNYRQNGWNLYANYDNRFFSRIGTGFSERTNLLTTGTQFLDEDRDFRWKGTSHNVKVGVDYTYERFHNFATSLTYNVGENSRTSNTKTLTYLNSVLGSNQLSKSAFNDDSYNLEFTLGYKKTFEIKDKEFKIDFYVSKDEDDEFTNRRADNYDPITNAFLGQVDVVNTDNIEPTFNTTLDISYVLPFSDDEKIEMGYKGTYRDRENDYTETNLQTSAVLKDDFVYKHLVNAAYGLYQSKLGGFKYQLGLRVEQSNSEGIQRVGNIKNTQDYIDFFPTVNFSQELAEGNELRVSYSRRINRPRMQSINPFIRYMNPTQAMIGNPNIKPEYINSYEISYGLFLDRASLIATSFYREINDQINRVSYIDNTGITFNTFDNIQKQKTYGFELSGTYVPFTFLNFNGGASYFKSEYEGTVSGGSRNSGGDAWFTRLSTTVRLPYDFDIQINTNFASAMISPQGTTKGRVFSDIGIKKTLFDKALTLSLRATDPFQTMQFRSESFGTNFTSITEMKPQFNSFTLSLTYNLNNFRKKQERPRDDNGGGGGGDMEGM